mgnify:CR=1 FL=1
MTEIATHTTPEVGGMGHSVKRKEDPRFIQGKGEGDGLDRNDPVYQWVSSLVDHPHRALTKFTEHFIAT